MAAAVQLSQIMSLLLAKCVTHKSVLYLSLHLWCCRWWKETFLTRARLVAVNLAMLCSAPQGPFGLLGRRTHRFTDTWFKFGHFFATSESHPFPWASFMSAHTCSVQQPIAHLSHNKAVGYGPGGHRPLGAQRTQRAGSHGSLERLPCLFPHQPSHAVHRMMAAMCFIFLHFQQLRMKTSSLALQVPGCGLELICN